MSKSLVEELKTGTCRITGKPYNCARCEAGKEVLYPNEEYQVVLHCNMSISGPLDRDSKQEWKRMAGGMICSDGSKPSPEDVRNYFMELHALGADALPMCECDDFCYRHGCRGHKKEKEENEQ